jgi:hypothetical protein
MILLISKMQFDHLYHSFDVILDLLWVLFDFFFFGYEFFYCVNFNVII